MRTATGAVILFAIVNVLSVSAASAQAKSGLYGNLTLGVDGATVTGAFSDARTGNGTDDAPQFSCLFVLRGVSGGGADGATKVTVCSVRLVSAATAEVRQAPVNGSSAKARLSKGDVVVIYRRIGPWLEGEDLNARRAVRGWLRASDLAPDQP